jgi:hypothetical protein
VNIYKRNGQDLLQASSYGQLYQVVRICGRGIIASRVRRKKEKLYLIREERITVERNENSTLPVEVGDFVFCDSGSKAMGRTWSLWKVEARHKLG